MKSKHYTSVQQILNWPFEVRSTTGLGRRRSLIQNHQALPQAVCVHYSTYKTTSPHVIEGRRHYSHFKEKEFGFCNFLFFPFLLFLMVSSTGQFQESNTDQSDSKPHALSIDLMPINAGYFLCGFSYTMNLRIIHSTGPMRWLSG